MIDTSARPAPSYGRPPADDMDGILLHGVRVVVRRTPDGWRWRPALGWTWYGEGLPDRAAAVEEARRTVKALGYSGGG